MKYLIDLGMKDVPLFFKMKRKYYKDFKPLKVGDYIESIERADPPEQSQLKVGAIEKLVTKIALKKNENHIFLINNNLCHEVSALTSALSFIANGEENRQKVILNYDFHLDSGDATAPTTVKFCNWGMCVDLELYKKNIQSSKKGQYITTGKIEKKEALEAITNQFAKCEEPIDLYVTIDTDVYKKSYTSYGDGNFEHSDILMQLEKLKKHIENSKGNINFCGGDVTGCIDYNKSYNIKDGKREYLSKEPKETRDAMSDDANNKILKLLDCLYSMRTV